MKIAYLILAHNTPGHLGRLVDSLQTDNAFFLIHVDHKSDLKDYSPIVAPNVRFTAERVPVYWGDFSQVEAILVLMKQALQLMPDAGRFVLLSGSDYPLRSAEAVERYFDGNPDKEFINLVAMPSKEANKPISRLTTYRARDKDKLGTLLAKIRWRLGLQQPQRDYRRALGALRPYAGSTWWALSRSACEYLMEFAARERRFVQFFATTVCPDESFFHTILGNSPFRDRVFHSLTYADWSSGGASPSLISRTHIDSLLANPKFSAADNYGAGDIIFARKFPNDSVELTRAINAAISESTTTAVTV